MSNLYQLARHFQRKYPGENSYLVFTGVLRINRMIYTCSVAWYAGSWAVISIWNARIAYPSSTWRLQCHVKDKDIIHPIISSAFRSRSSFTTSLRRNGRETHLWALIQTHRHLGFFLPGCPLSSRALLPVQPDLSQQYPKPFQSALFPEFELGFILKSELNRFICFLLRESL